MSPNLKSGNWLTFSRPYSARRLETSCDGIIDRDSTRVGDLTLIFMAQLWILWLAEGSTFVDELLEIAQSLLYSMIFLP